MEFGEVSLNRREHHVYVRLTDLLLLPLLISAVTLIYKQNYGRLNLGSPATPPQLELHF
jgi:hypothetical protein